MYLNESQLPYSLGEVDPGGYGRYLGLGNIFDDIASAAAKIAGAAAEASRIKEGDAKLAVVPSQGASITFPVPGSPLGATVPILPLALGAGFLLYLAFRKK